MAHKWRWTLADANCQSLADEDVRHSVLNSTDINLDTESDDQRVKMILK